MNELTQIFNYNNNEVRTVLIDEEVWFVAKDICDVLEIKNVSQALNRLNDKMKGIYNMNNTVSTVYSIGNPNNAIINEAGIYKLVFTSRKPEAERFVDFIAEEVIPSIRKTGKFDVIENEIMKIEDEEERTLTLRLYELRSLRQPDAINMLQLAEVENKLAIYKAEKEIKLVKIEQTEQRELLTELNEKVEKKLPTLVERKAGEFYAQDLAVKLNVRSIKNNPHTQLINAVARLVGLPIMLDNYENDFIRTGIKENMYSPNVVYKSLAKQQIENWFLNNQPQIKYFQRGNEKGQVNYKYFTIAGKEYKVL